MRRLAGSVLIASIVAGCSLVPNMDSGTSGCSNAQGVGPRDAVGMEGETSSVAPVFGKDPTTAARIAQAMGHTVVFNVQITGYGECWCVPPPEGRVTEAMFTDRGALMLFVDGVDEGHTAANQPPTGWGCA